MLFANSDSPVCMIGGYHIVSSLFHDRERLAERFRSGNGSGWHEQKPELFAGTDQLFRPGYKKTINDDVSVVLVGPNAKDTLAENMNPVERVLYAVSTMVCIPSSLDQEVGLGLGAQAGQGRLGDVAGQAGFHHFRRATEAPLNMI